jgi:exodeoxyribonuclease VII small subunit
MAEKIEKLTFEQALTMLEGIVRDLEDEKITLDDSIGKFELGVKLSSYCLEKLNEAEKKIEELTRSEDGSLATKNLKLDE